MGVGGKKSAWHDMKLICLHTDLLDRYVFRIIVCSYVSKHILNVNTFTWVDREEHVTLQVMSRHHSVCHHINLSSSLGHLLTRYSRSQSKTQLTYLPTTPLIRIPGFTYQFWFAHCRVACEFDTFNWREWLRIWSMRLCSIHSFTCRPPWTKLLLLFAFKYLVCFV